MLRLINLTDHVESGEYPVLILRKLTSRSLLVCVNELLTAVDFLYPSF